MRELDLSKNFAQLVLACSMHLLSLRADSRDSPKRSEVSARRKASLELKANSIKLFINSITTQIHLPCKKTFLFPCSVTKE